jgi:uncharacterized Zn finger protein (UPF0148 family)
MDGNEYQKLNQEFSRFLLGDPNSPNTMSAPNPFVMDGPFICSRCDNVGSPVFDHTGKLGCYQCKKCANDYRRWDFTRHVKFHGYKAQSTPHFPDIGPKN